ncbi:methionine adenosyltransferase 2 subunit beta [Gaeumannomyces tritici R3-111a-1]|uniref:Methionine adenosyltransferase 2 subunit beta n=1 Tax=Gaeumannomyces tritici (strain R3-111a-1) TaxID=644352 RepID=J3P123_GAET3|nr:methionine adenosyltransferase 2 subunit beta [Gaeumannomyces tritici R3-111a-1]EJT77308.1 methionine adenosyltransferase 2 subunit beta [Gaeumannomyces tritici R3-111a-1]
MSDKRVLITGATGLLGREVVRAFQDKKGWAVTGAAFSRADGVSILKVDLGNVVEIEKALDKIRPQVVVHCAANRFPDKVDKDPEGTRRLNVAATGTLARLCAATGAVLIYISTDYVFSGRPGEAPYAADAETGPTNLYGQTKLDGERAVLEAYGGGGKGKARGVVLRVPVLYGHAETPAESAVNVLMDVLWQAQGDEAKAVKMDHWALRYPTNTEDVGRVCADVAEKYLDTDDSATLPKLLQFSSEDKLTKYEICQLFGEIMGLSSDKIEPTTEGNDPSATVQRPYDCHLGTRELRDLGIDVSTQDFSAWWRREVRAFRK